MSSEGCWPTIDHLQHHMKKKGVGYYLQWECWRLKTLVDFAPAHHVTYRGHLSRGVIGGWRSWKGLSRLRCRWLTDGVAMPCFGYLSQNLGVCNTLFSLQLLICCNVALLLGWLVTQQKHKQQWPTDRLYHMLCTLPPSDIRAHCRQTSAQPKKTKKKNSLRVKAQRDLAPTHHVTYCGHLRQGVIGGWRDLKPAL